MNPAPCVSGLKPCGLPPGPTSKPPVIVPPAPLAEACAVDALVAAAAIIGAPATAEPLSTIVALTTEAALRVAAAVAAVVAAGAAVVGALVALVAPVVAVGLVDEPPHAARIALAAAPAIPPRNMRRESMERVCAEFMTDLLYCCTDLRYPSPGCMTTRA